MNTLRNARLQELVFQRLHLQVPHTALVLLALLLFLWYLASRRRQHLRSSVNKPVYRSQSNSPTVPHNKSTSQPLPPIPCEPEAAQTDPSHSTPALDEESMVPSEPEDDPTWSVEYHPEAKQVLDLHLANVVTYRAPVLCVKISPEGHRIAIGLPDGTTYLNELKTGSNIWLVSSCSESRHLD